jgi:hypothetical protein
MSRFSGILTTLLVSVAVAALLSTVGVAQQNTSDVQVTLKSKNWGPDPTWGGSRATITIATNKMGKLVYNEEYYGTDSDGQPKLYQGNRYETVMTDYTVTFDVMRPDHHRHQSWTMIKSLVMLDNVNVYEVWINTSGTYKSFTGRAIWQNNSVIDIGKGRPVVQKREPFNPMGGVTATTQTNNTASVNTVDNSTKTIVPEKSPMVEIPLAIAILFTVYFFSNRKNGQ